MAAYNINGNELSVVHGTNGLQLSQAYDIEGNELLSSRVVIDDIVYESAHSKKNLYAGGLIEIQPDSWDGSTVCTGDIVEPTDSTAWGFPMSLSSRAKETIKNDIFSGSGFGISFIRFPMGFAYRGYRNIDPETGLAKNIGQRFEGQNSELNSWFSNICQSGGGLDVEYWCPAPYWLTGGAYYNANVKNELWAGGSYSRTTTLESIRTTDPTQYAKQINDFTDAIVNDLEYVHQNVAPVRMYTLAAEPTGTGQLKYGHCHWSTSVYNDVFAVLNPKVKSSKILSEVNGKENEVLMHLCADHISFSIGSAIINSHSDWIWGYSHDVIRAVSGESGIGADQLKSLTFPSGSQASWKNVFICEYEYFSTTSKTNEYRFSNNVVRMIFELAYRKAKIIMPIIHVCKPTGQSSSQTNTAGYCLYAIDMTNGDYTVNSWAYNSWKMFNDNLPIGAEFIKGGDGGLENAGYVEFEKDGITYLLFGNYSSEDKTITLTFDEDKAFSGKLYTANVLGMHINDLIGNELTVTIPAYSGLVYTEMLNILPNRTLIWHDEFNGPELDLSKWINVYGNYRNYNWNSPDIHRNTNVENGILSYWTAKDYPNSVSDFSGSYICTNNLFEFRYGRVEAKIRFTDASPHHVTFWTLGACSETISTGETTLYDMTKGVLFPSCGEIDIAEYNNGSVGARTHWATNGFDTNGSAAQGGNIEPIVSNPSEWHIYACEWTDKTIKFYADGVEKRSWDISNATVNGWNPFTIPHFLILNCISSIGGTINWDIAKTDVAWVRVYAPEGVTEYIEETAISIPSEISISVGERRYIESIFTPENPSDMTIIWESGNTDVCTVYGGMVIGVSSGSTVITAKTKHGCVAYCTVTVS